MRVLGIESSSTTASMAVIENDELIGEYTMNNTMKHSRTLMPMLEDLLKRMDMDVRSLDLISVSEGPGSFTGLRIGSATAKGLAHGLGVSIASIPTLEVLASTVTVPDAKVGVIVFARAREVYFAQYVIRFEKGLFYPEEISAIESLEVDALIKRLDEATVNTSTEEVPGGSAMYLVGDGLTKFREDFECLQDRYIIPRSIFCSLSAKQVALLGLNRYYKGDVMTYFQQKPYYHKKSQAEREYEEKNR